MDLPTDESSFKTFDSVVLDQEGFVICQVHRERRYGWRSVPYTAQAPQQALTAGMTALEHERWLVWGEVPRTRPWPSQSRTEDRRDNRDPQEIGAEILRKNIWNETSLGPPPSSAAQNGGQLEIPGT